MVCSTFHMLSEELFSMQRTIYYLSFWSCVTSLVEGFSMQRIAYYMILLKVKGL